MEIYLTYFYEKKLFLFSILVRGVFICFDKEE